MTQPLSPAAIEKQLFAQETAKMLLEVQAVLFNPDKPFIFTSGWASPVYTDMRKIISYPRLRKRILDFAVTTIENAGVERFDEALVSFYESLGEGDVALFFFHSFLHIGIERSHGSAFAHHFERDPLLNIAHSPAVVDQALGCPTQHVDETRTDRQSLHIDFLYTFGLAQITDEGDGVGIDR